ncbi:MAG TPA: RNHCP domain-containing protein [Dehalococcoidia bacterium]|nr:RNHCP domain-containing protein [Dehalococcoidia bacterium]
MSRGKENTGFTCDNCGSEVLPLTNGSYRNHCPFCLYSKHVDAIPGDRGETCGGMMKPVRLVCKPGKGYQLIHKCLTCGRERTNRIAEYSIQPDEIEELLKLL